MSDVNPESSSTPVAGPDGRIECPACHSRVGAGVAGTANLKRHMESERCKALSKKLKHDQNKFKQQTLVKSYFNAPPKVPPHVSRPLAIRPTSSQPLRLIQPSQSVPETSGSKVAACPLGLSILSRFSDRIQALQADLTVPEAGSDHELVPFSMDPRGCVPDDEDAWETWDPPLNTLLQKEPPELRKLVVRGEKGLVGLHRFLLYLVTEHGIQGGLIEGKIERLLKAMDEV